MRTIHQLSRHTISLIAAGEIAERPSGIVKELVENSLDAGATHIEIQLEESGLKKIVVADNGQGITEEDLPLTVASHATSKITSAEDLDRITSFGFRGEALASIAKVSQLSVISRHQNADSAFHFNAITQRLEPSRFGMAIGTLVEVKNLFAQVPARRKFLDKPASELRRVIETVTALALVHPTVSFSLHHNQKLLVQFPAEQTLQDRFLQATSWELASHILPVAQSNDVLSISGLILHPSQARAHGQYQWLYVNNRLVSHPPLAKAIKKAYQVSIPPEKQPSFLLHLNMNPGLFDINRHPKKETIAFMDEKLVLEHIHQAVSTTLGNLLGTRDQLQGDLPDQPDITGLLTLREPQTTENSTKHRGHFPADSSLSAKLKSLITPWKQSSGQSEVKSAPVEILQLFNTYLVTKHEGQLVMIDQHAAHERILFEAFRAAYSQEQKSNQQELQPPITISLNPQQALLVEEHLETLAKIGFHGHDLGDQTFVITSVPELVPIEHIRRIFADVLADLEEGNPVALADTVAHRTLAYLACRSAIMGGDPLEPAERANLLAQLLRTPNYQTCPHGRPTISIFDQKRLEKEFSRR